MAPDVHKADGESAGEQDIAVDPGTGVQLGVAQTVALEVDPTQLQAEP